MRVSVSHGYLQKINLLLTWVIIIFMLPRFMMSNIPCEIEYDGYYKINGWSTGSNILSVCKSVNIICEGSTIKSQDGVLFCEDLKTTYPIKYLIMVLVWVELLIRLVILMIPKLRFSKLIIIICSIFSIMIAIMMMTEGLYIMIIYILGIIWMIMLEFIKSDQISSST